MYSWLQVVSTEKMKQRRYADPRLDVHSWHTQHVHVCSFRNDIVLNSIREQRVPNQDWRAHRSEIRYMPLSLTYLTHAPSAIGEELHRRGMQA